MELILSNKYQVIKALGKGGMGEVFLVKDLHLDRMAAAKRMRVEEGHRIESFRREMELLRELDHPALPAVYDFFQEEDWFYLVMEYVDGITLEQYMQQNGRVSAHLAVQWAIELTEVLGYLHRKTPKIIYRDLKPGNIMVRAGGRLKLIDLGGCLKNTYGSSRESGYVGTPGYSPPQQWNEEAGESCDIYSLGAVLHEMLTGAGPISSIYERRPIREYDRSFSPGLERIVMKCIAREPNGRYASMEHLKKALVCDLQKDNRYRIGWLAGNICSACLWLLVAGTLAIPLVRGVPEDQIPFPYLERPLLVLAAAIFFRIICFRKPKNVIRRIEKNIQLTEKHYAGL